ncbi:YbhB/YbcL family Raf kinase inhibitor-like protein [Paraburkholderia sp. J12]|uniref:YbhB/YbcL family Raf kinase inhibitor-like protein n=1 Tax=Paraburkholderia sp. J12 TaxID=2805432 RepID=UPI002ABD58DC|nr:YbhB/YbcL family Raf kinase inhibitor-like protein [Paraburkholderia sp. J12]
MAASFEVNSTDAKNGILPVVHFTNMMGCPGENISPEVSWSGAPAGTKSFVVTMYDQDAATGSGWWHWVVVNVPASATSLPRGAGGQVSRLPAGAIQTNTDAGMAGYGGPCPPVGETHRYLITVKALDVEKLDLPPNATGALVGFLSNMHKLGEAKLTLTGAR